MIKLDEKLAQKDSRLLRGARAHRPRVVFRLPRGGVAGSHQRLCLPRSA